MYITTHQRSIQNADKYNLKFKELLEEENETAESITDDDGYDFGHEYSVKTKIRDAPMADISAQYKVRLTRCRKCLVVRVPGAHHCTRCKGCVLKFDHHCPWINNCIGMFNRKHFLLFCWYTFVGTSHGMVIAVYYTIYRSKKE
jgi:hypothetical protein